MSQSSFRKYFHAFIPAIFLIALLITSFSAFAAANSAFQEEGLFVETANTGTLDFAGDQTIVRTRFVTVNMDMLDQAEVGDTLVLNLFDGVTFNAILDRKATALGGGYSWSGHLEGVPLGNVVITVGGGQVAGNVSMPEAFYQVRYSGDQTHAIHQIDQSAFPSEKHSMEVILSPEEIAAAADDPMGDDGSVIDALVVYTAAARSGAGGTTAMLNLINLAVAETNTSYSNSGITQQLNLVHTAEVVYTESGNITTDRNRLQNPSDGYVDNVHTMRDTYEADVVTMIVENGGGYCGIAYIMTSVSTSFENYAFNITARNCATGYYSFGHELGHIMSARHDWYADATSYSPYSYNHGFTNPTDGWRTVMAYNSECVARGTSCTRLQYWSNPNVSYGGDPMGVPAGTSTACTSGSLSNPACDANNRLTLNNTAWTVANFRDSTSGANVGPLVYYSRTIDDDNLGNSSGNSDGVVDCGETIEMFVDLTNLGTDTATGVNATISSSDPYISFLFNTGSSYPDIAGGGVGTNIDDFDFSVDPTTPHGHYINFDLNISAANGGPWTDSFSVPVTCINPDAYEPDDSAGAASTITSGSPQTHTIYPVGDEDWVTFTLASESQIELETSGSTGDTRMWLYNAALMELEYNDDGGAGLFSFIDRVCDVDALPAGTYYVKVDEYGDNHAIPPYEISYTLVQSCAAPEIDVSPTSFDFVVPEGQSDAAPMTIYNLGSDTLNWSVSAATFAQVVIGEWVVNYDWGCSGFPGTMTTIFNPDFTFTTSEGSSGTWVLNFNQIVFTFTNGTEYTGIVDGDSIMGTMVGYTGSTGCWDAQRLTYDQIDLQAGEMDASGESASQPSAIYTYASQLYGLIEPVVIDDIATPNDFAGIDATTGEDHQNAPHQQLSEPRDILSGGSVLWDLTHGVYSGYEPSGFYTSLVSSLNSMGFTIDTTSAGVNNVPLANYDILVVNLGSNWNSVYTAAEVTAIQNFVSNGGGLVILGDNPITPNANINPVSQVFGSTFGLANLGSPISNLAAHPIFAGVASLDFPVGGQVSAASPAGLVAWDPAGVGAISIAEVGSGKVVMIGDINLWDNNTIANLDNQLFAANTFNWLSPSWLSASPAVGTVPGGGYQIVTVNVDATGLPIGMYYGTLTIHSNDPDEEYIVIPVTLEVIPAATCPDGPNTDYFTTQDNQNNALTGSGDCDMDVYLFNDDPLTPIEFDIFVSNLAGVNQLFILAYDVDETSGEVDEVYFNGHFAGALTGANSTWSTTALALDPAWVNAGYNLVEVLVDTANPGAPTWAVNIDWGQLNTSTPQQAFIRQADTEIITPPPYNPGDTIQVKVEVDTNLATQDVRTEVNLRDPGDVNIDGEVIFHTVNGTTNDYVVSNLTIPGGAALGPGYDVQVLVYDASTLIFQDTYVLPPFEVEPVPLAELWIDPPASTIPVSGTGVLDVLVTDAADLYGVSLEILFDPTYLEVVDADPGTSGVQIAPGTCPLADFVVQNSVDNALGVIQYDVSSLNPTPPCNGNGTIASITFHGKTAGTSIAVNFNSWLLSDSGGNPISVSNVHNGLVNVIPQAQIEGYVDLQGRGNESGAEVCATGSSSPICTITDPSGYYLLSTPPDTYAVTVEMEQYLDAEKLGVVVTTGTTTLNPVTLLGGDINGDDTVNILDIVRIASHYNQSCGHPDWDPLADVNADCTINILDIVLAAGNYLVSSPVPWP